MNTQSNNPIAEEKKALWIGDSSSVQLSVAIVAVFFTAWEAISGHMHTKLVVASAHSSEIAQTGLLNMATLLGLSFVALILFNSIGTEQSSRSGFQQALDYLSSTRVRSFLSDLLIKYVFLCMLVITGHGFAMAAALALFTADYLIQGRLFVLPAKCAEVLAACSIGLACLLYSQGSAYLVWPLVMFSLIALASTCFAISLTKNPSTKEV